MTVWNQPVKTLRKKNISIWGTTPHSRGTDIVIKNPKFPRKYKLATVKPQESVQLHYGMSNLVTTSLRIIGIMAINRTTKNPQQQIQLMRKVHSSPKMSYFKSKICWARASNDNVEVIWYGVFHKLNNGHANLKHPQGVKQTPIDATFQRKKNGKLKWMHTVPTLEWGDLSHFARAGHIFTWGLLQILTFWTPSGSGRKGFVFGDERPTREGWWRSTESRWKNYIGNLSHKHEQAWTHCCAQSTTRPCRDLFSDLYVSVLHALPHQILTVGNGFWKYLFWHNFNGNLDPPSLPILFGQT